MPFPSSRSRKGIVGIGVEGSAGGGGAGAGYTLDFAQAFLPGRTGTSECIYRGMVWWA